MQGTDRAAELAASRIGKRFGGFAALSDIDLQIGRGEFLTLLGPSGSGKTTFLMILAGFEPPSSGSLSLDGRDITALPAEQRHFGMVFQGYALFPHMSVFDNIAFALKVLGRPKEEVRKRVGASIELMGLQGHERKRPAGLSGGQQQRVALARALVYEPPVLLLDEPFSALDKNLRGQMQDEVRRLHGETGTTFVFVTHDQSEALALSTRIAIFDGGRLQQVGAPQEVYEHPANRFVAEFLGELNILPLSEVAGDACLTKATFEGQLLRLAVGTPSQTFAIRPEALRLSVQRPASGNAIAARIEAVVYQGAETRLTARTGGGVPLTLKLPTADLPQGLGQGSEIWAGWPEDRGFFL